MSAECDHFDFDEMNEPCHNGIYRTAENIYNRLVERNILEKAFNANPVIIKTFLSIVKINI